MDILAIGGHLPCDLDLRPFDLEHVSHVALCTGMIVTKFDIGQPIPSRLNVFTAETLHHVVTLTCNPLTLNVCIVSAIM